MPTPPPTSTNDWRETVPKDDAKTFVGVFANQNIVCKLTQPATVSFLRREFLHEA